MMKTPSITSEGIPTDTEVKDFLLNNDKVPVLEEILSKECKKLLNLNAILYPYVYGVGEKERRKLDFGPRLDVTELRNVFPDVKKEVDDFLGVSNVGNPLINGGCWSRSKLYNGLRTTVIGVTLLPAIPLDVLALMPDPTDPITVPLAALLTLPATLLAGSYIYFGKKPRIRISHFDSKRCKAIPVLAHEYAHHIQRRKISCLRNPDYSLPLRDTAHGIFEEGHARGVEREIAKQYSERENNKAFEYDTQGTIVGELSSTYKCLSKKLGITPCKSLTKGSTFLGVDSHSMGTTFFHLLKELKGKSVYREAFAR